MCRRFLASSICYSLSYQRSVAKDQATLSRWSAMLCPVDRKWHEWKWQWSTVQNAVFKLSTFLATQCYMLSCTQTQLRLKTGTAHTQTELLGDPTPASSDADKRSSCARICSGVHCFDTDLGEPLATESSGTLVCFYRLDVSLLPDAGRCCWWRWWWSRIVL
jgi:hypothetical protein